MEREIKFRAWDGKGMLSTPISTIYGLSRFFGVIPEDCKLMQYTEQKDKNGKEIYDGDVVSICRSGFVSGNFEKPI